VYNKLLKPRQSFLITLYYVPLPQLIVSIFSCHLLYFYGGSLRFGALKNCFIIWS